MAHTQRVGRGGAGNYRSGSDDRTNTHVSSASTAADAASQISNQEDPSVILAVAPPGPVRGGRGGAGNFTDPADLPDARESAREVGAALANCRQRQQQQQQQAGAKDRRAMGGRGRAGNWVEGDGIDDEKYNDYDEWDEPEPRGRKVEELERKVKEVVDKGLRMPDKVHHAADRGGHR